MEQPARAAPRRARGPGALAAWLPALAWAGLIFLLSAQPGLRFADDPLLDLVVRKVGHMGVFGILAGLVWLALARTTALRRPWLGALAVAVLYAVGDELHQGLVAGRTASALDVAIDALGVVAALAALRWLGRLRDRHRAG